MASPSSCFLDSVDVGEDGYLYLSPRSPRYPPKEFPSLLPHSQTLWNLLYAPVIDKCPHPGSPQGEPFETTQLQRSKGLMEAIRLSLHEIEQCRDTKADKSMRLNVNRLQKQQTLRLNQASPEACHILKQQAYVDATVRIIKTLNSIRAIFPLLIKMFHHEKRKSTTLEIQVVPKKKQDDVGKESIAEKSENEDENNSDDDNTTSTVAKTVTLETIAQEKNKKKKNKQGAKSFTWLLGDYVYDVAQNGQFKALNEILRGILECLVGEKGSEFTFNEFVKDEDDSFWQTFLPELIEKNKARTAVPSPSSLFGTQQQQAVEIAKQCDEKHLDVFHHENQDAQQARIRYQAAVDKLMTNLRMLLQKRFRGCEVRVYGSCLSNLALGRSSDVDISLHLPAFAQLKRDFETGRIEAKKYEQQTKKTVFQTNDLLTGHRSGSLGFRIHDCVTRARVPVIKGTYLLAGNPYSLDGSLDFDICFSNEIAVVNSALLSEYTLVDERVKSFLLSIKAWAKLYGLSSAADNRISSYAWVNLGVFYLQCIGFVPNLQCRELMAQHGFEVDPGNWSHCANDLDTAFMPWCLVVERNVWMQPDEWKDTPVTLLMYGFFHFYANHFPKTWFAVSMREGGVVLPKMTFDKIRIQHLCIEDPFETHGSHTSHDLGRPAGEVGHPVIAEALLESEAILRAVLVGENNDEEAYFWRLTEVAQTPPESLCNSLHVNPTLKPSAPNRGRNKSSKKGRKNGANNPFQKKAKMQPPQENGAKHLTPNNEFQRNQKDGNTVEKDATAGSLPGESRGRRPRRAKKKHPRNEDGSDAGAKAPVATDDKQSHQNSRSHNNQKEKSPGRRRGGGKQKHSGEHSSAAGKQAEEQNETVALEQAKASDDEATSASKASSSHKNPSKKQNPRVEGQGEGGRGRRGRPRRTRGKKNTGGGANVPKEEARNAATVNGEATSATQGTENKLIVHHCRDVEIVNP